MMALTKMDYQEFREVCSRFGRITQPIDKNAVDLPPEHWLAQWSIDKPMFLTEQEAWVPITYWLGKTLDHLHRMPLVLDWNTVNCLCFGQIDKLNDVLLNSRKDIDGVKDRLKDQFFREAVGYPFCELLVLTLFLAVHMEMPLPSPIQLPHRLFRQLSQTFRISLVFYQLTGIHAPLLPVGFYSLPTEQ